MIKVEEEKQKKLNYELLRKQRLLYSIYAIDFRRITISTIPES